MRKLNLFLLILIFCNMTCTLDSKDKIDKQSTDSQSGRGNELIVTEKRLDFSKHKVTFIELGADKCIPCKAMQPVMRDIARKFKGTIQVVFYDVWKTPEYARKYGIRMIPTQVFMDRNGKEIFRHVGFFSKEDIIKRLKEKRAL